MLLFRIMLETESCFQETRTPKTNTVKVFELMIIIFSECVLRICFVLSFYSKNPKLSTSAAKINSNIFCNAEPRVK